MIRIEIDEKCIGCGTCEKYCPTRVFKVVNKKSTTPQIKECMVCRLCEVICPVKTINVIEE